MSISTEKIREKRGAFEYHWPSHILHLANHALGPIKRRQCADPDAGNLETAHFSKQQSGQGSVPGGAVYFGIGRKKSRPMLIYNRPVITWRRVFFCVCQFVTISIVSIFYSFFLFRFVFSYLFIILDVICVRVCNRKKKRKLYIHIINKNNRRGRLI